MLPPFRCSPQFVDLIPGPWSLSAKLDEPVDGHLDRFLVGMLARLSLPMDESFKGVKDSQQLHVRYPGEQASTVNSFFCGPKRCLHSTVCARDIGREGYGLFQINPAVKDGAKVVGEEALWLLYENLLIYHF